MHLYPVRQIPNVKRYISGNCTFCNVTQGKDSSIRPPLQPGVGCDALLLPPDKVVRGSTKHQVQQKTEKTGHFFPCAVSWIINRAKLLHWS